MTIYDSYNVELAAKYRQSISIASPTKQKKNTTIASPPENICYINSLSPGAGTGAVQLH